LADGGGEGRRPSFWSIAALPKFWGGMFECHNSVITLVKYCLVS
jgi:hypothetical protein